MAVPSMYQWLLLPLILFVPAGEEDTFEWTEEELEEGPEQLAVLETDTEVDGGPAWSPLFSSSNDQLKSQVRPELCWTAPDHLNTPAGSALAKR